MIFTKFHDFQEILDIQWIFRKWTPKTPIKPCARGYFSPWGVKSVKYAKFHFFRDFHDFYENDENLVILVKFS